MKNNQLKTIISSVTLLLLINFSAEMAKAQMSGQEVDIIKEEETQFEAITITPWKRVRFLYTLKGHNSPIYGLAFNPQGNILISTGSNNDPRMRFWSMTDGKQIADVRAHAAAVLSLAVSPDGKTIATAGLDAGINLWSGFNRQLLSSFLIHANSVLSLAITPDSSTLVSGGLDGIKVWNLQYRRPAYTLVGVGNPSYVLAIHPKGSILASGDDKGTVQFWNLKTGNFESEFYPHQETITGLIFTADGKQIITSSKGKTVKIWDLRSGKLVKELSGHQDEIRALALSPDGQTLASGGKDGVKIWNLATGELFNSIPSNNDWVESLAFSPDSTMLAVGWFNNDIQVWRNAFPQPIIINEKK